MVAKPAGAPSEGRADEDRAPMEPLPMPRRHTTRPARPGDEEIARQAPKGGFRDLRGTGRSTKAERSTKMRRLPKCPRFSVERCPRRPRPEGSWRSRRPAATQIRRPPPSRAGARVVRTASLRRFSCWNESSMPDIPGLQERESGLAPEGEAHTPGRHASMAVALHEYGRCR